MQKFSFEKFKNGAKVLTGYGREVTNLTYFPDVEGDDFCLAGVVEGEIRTWTIDGVFNITKEYELGNSWDLCHPEEEMYVNAYTTTNPYNISIGTRWFRTREAAEEAGEESSLYSGTYKLVKI